MAKHAKKKAGKKRSKKKAGKKRSKKKAGKKRSKKKAGKKRARRRSMKCRTLLVRATSVQPGMRLAGSGEEVARVGIGDGKKRGSVSLIVTKQGNAYAVPNSRKVAVVSC